MVLPDEKHQYKNTSAKSPVVMICAVPKEYE
jgi:quercetin dioxygenase-like cupin family protein